MLNVGALNMGSQNVSNTVIICASAQRQVISLPYDLEIKYDDLLCTIKTNGLPRTQGCSLEKLGTGYTEYKVILSSECHIQLRQDDENTTIEVTGIYNQ